MAAPSYAVWVSNTTTVSPTQHHVPCVPIHSFNSSFPRPATENTDKVFTGYQQFVPLAQMPTSMATTSAASVVSGAGPRYPFQPVMAMVYQPQLIVQVPSNVILAQQQTLPGPAARPETPGSRCITPAKPEREHTISQQDQSDTDDCSDVISVTGDDDQYVNATVGFQKSHLTAPILRPVKLLDMTPANSVFSGVEGTVSEVFDIEDGMPEEVALERQCCIQNDVCAEKNAAGEVMYYVCPQHRLKFKYRRHLEQHFLLHRRKERPSLCHMCGKCFTRADHLNRHAKVHTNWKLICQLCGTDNIPRPSHLFRHWQKIHPHMQNLSDDSKTDSSACSSGISTATTPMSPLPVKRRRTSSSSSVDVESCAKRPADPASLARYQEAGYIAQLASTTQITSDKYVCKTCHRKFNRQAHLQRHQRIHTGERPFHCIVCLETFARGDYLQTHMTVQHNDTPLDCEVCGLSFQQIKTLFEHNKEKHRNFKPSFLRDSTMPSPLAASYANTNNTQAVSEASTH